MTRNDSNKLRGVTKTEENPEFVEIHVKIKVGDPNRGRVVMDALRAMSASAQIQVKYPALGWTWLNINNPIGE